MDQSPRNLPQQAPKPRKPRAETRISPRIREAITLRVRQGLSWDECAKRANLSPVGLWKARKRDNVKALYEQEVQAFIAEAEAMRAPLKAMAIQRAGELARTAKSEAVQARMVEFLAGESKAAPSVNVNVSTTIGGAGYEFVPPGAQIIDITPAPAPEPDALDNQSSDQGDEGPTE